MPGPPDKFEGEYTDEDKAWYFRVKPDWGRVREEAEREVKQLLCNK